MALWESKLRSLRGMLFASICVPLVLAGNATHTLSAEDEIAWRIGEDFRRQLDATIGFHWESSPVGEGLARLSANQRVAIWLDRRVDPDHEVDLLIRDTTLDEALRRVGSALGGGVGYVDSVAYVGSPTVTKTLATLAAIRRDEVKQLPTAARTRFATVAAWKWETLATPSELFSQLAESANAKIVNIEQIPHDLWRAGDLPALPLTDRMCLVLAGFDLTFEIARDGSAIRIIPMPTDAVVERTYSPSGSLNTAATTIGEAFPKVVIKKVGARLAITGTQEEHELIERLIRGETIRRDAPVPGIKLFDLKVENQPIGAIIKAVADRESLQIKMDLASQLKLQKLISLDIKQLTLEELLNRALLSTGVTHRVGGGVLELSVP